MNRDDVASVVAGMLWGVAAALGVLAVCAPDDTPAEPFTYATQRVTPPPADLGPMLVPRNPYPVVPGAETGASLSR